jgi:formylglycine-generating enzyme required for sulfatase activity
MKTKQTFVYGARSLIRAITVVLALAFTALSLTGCPDDNDSNPGGGGINKTNPTVTWPQGLTAVHGQTLSAIPLASYTNNGGTPGAFSWTTPAASVGNYGAQSHNMTFTPTDTASYNTAVNNVSVLVSLAEMVRVAGGTFTMGSPDTEDDRYDNETQWQVTLSGFYMGKTEVTQKQYETVIGSLPSSLNSDTYGKGDGYPVYYVRWYDAIVFCNKLSVLEGLSPAYSIGGKTAPDEWGEMPTSTSHENYATWNGVVIVANSNGYRLPTEAQWEYACRAGTTTPWHSGDTDDSLDDYAWYWDNIPSQTSGETGYGTQPVGTKQANDFGLYDMHGNVWEWCWDWYDTYPTTAGTDPVGASSGSYRVLRGGSWFDPARYARSACRDILDPYSRDYFLGFRVLRP